MARQFRGAAKGRGFNPIPISGANITRMREENERIIRGMKERRESQRRNEERQLQAMQSDAAYYEKIRNRNFDITNKNLKNEQLQLQYDAEADAQRSEQEFTAVKAVFEAVADFSKTAAKIKKEEEEEKEEEKKKLGRWQRARFGPTGADISFKRGLDAEAEGQERVRSSVQEGRETGSISEYDAQKALNITQTGSVAFQQHDIVLTTRSEWPLFFRNWINENAPEALASPEAIEKVRYEAWWAFEKSKGWTNLSEEMVGPALDLKEQMDATFTAGVTSVATKNLNAQNITGYTNAAIADWDNQAVSSYHGVAKTSGHDEAHVWYNSQATAMNQNGEFVVSDTQWKNTSLKGDGQPYYVDPGTTVTVETPTGTKTFTQGSHQARGLKILNTRADRLREWRRNQNTDDRLSHNEESKAWRGHLLEHPEDIGAAKKSFEDNYLGEPEWLRKLTHAGHSSQGSYNANLISTAEDLQARGMLYQGIVDKVYERDPKQGNTLQESLNKQDPFMRDNLYKQYYESIDKLPLKQDLGGNYPEPNADAIRATEALQDAYRELVERGVADGASIKDASYSAMKAIESGFNDPNSSFYRQYNANTAQYEFTKLYSKTPKEIAEDIDQADTQFLKNLDAGHNKTKLKQSMFAQPEIVLTSSQYDQQIVDMESPGFTFHPRIDMLVQSGAADSHMAALALVGAAQKKPPIVPPLSLQVTSEYSPAANRMLAKWGSRSPNIEARAHGAGQQNLVPEAGLALVPVDRIPNLREFYRASAERHGVSPAENAAMGEIESNHGTATLNDKGISVSYNGTSEGVMQINRSAHPDFYAQHNGNPSHEANIEYGTKYYAEKKREFNGDAIAAAMAYNGGSGHYRAWLAGKKPAWVTNPKQTPKEREDSEKEWVRIVDEMVNHGTKFAKAYYKYSGDASLLQHPLVLRK